MKIKKMPVALSALLLSLWAAFADDAPVKQNAWFDLKMHNTVGYNLEEKIYGMESTIDQAQICLRLLQHTYTKDDSRPHKR